MLSASAAKREILLKQIAARQTSANGNGRAVNHDAYSGDHDSDVLSADHRSSSTAGEP
jgi:hypothetical protein